MLYMGVCNVQIKHKNKKITCEFFVMPGGGPALLGLSDMELLDMLCITCSTIDIPLLHGLVIANVCARLMCEKKQI